MKILHTSDWHLGQLLCAHKRYDEFEGFLNWLRELIQKEGIDLLLVAGDIFDTTTPGSRAQELYYRFLYQAAGCCQHVVIIAGNHDSPSFLSAPKELLKALNIHVVGSIYQGIPAEGNISEEIAEEVIVLRDKQGRTEAIVCAVPYLRDRELRSAEAGESSEEKGLKLLEGLKSHYAEVCAVAERIQSESGDIPIIATGHLFIAGGKTIIDNGERDLYVGNLAQVGSDVFPASIDYLALGHLHVPQIVSHRDHYRYSGSPIPLGFGEAGQKKQVIIIEFAGRKPSVRDITVPCFQELKRVAGTIEEIAEQIEELITRGSSAWIEVEYTGSSVVPDLRERVEKALENSDMLCLRIKNRQSGTAALSDVTETLDTLSCEDVFIRCLKERNTPEEEWEELLQSYREILVSMQENDNNASLDI